MRVIKYLSLLEIWNTLHSISCGVNVKYIITISWLCIYCACYKCSNASFTQRNENYSFICSRCYYCVITNLVIRLGSPVLLPPGFNLYTAIWFMLIKFLLCLEASWQENIFIHKCVTKDFWCFCFIALLGMH